MKCIHLTIEYMTKHISYLYVHNCLLYIVFLLFFLYIACFCILLQNYLIIFYKINNYYKAFSVAHPEFSFSAQNFHLGASLPFTVTTYCLQPHAPLKDHTHTQTQTPVCRETFKRVYSPNNFTLMLLRNVLMLCVWTLAFVPH